MNQPESATKRFRGRRAEMASIGYYLEEHDFGLEFFVSDNGNRIDAEDVLLADWPNWRALLRKAQVEA